MRAMPEIEKDLQYFKEEVAKEYGYKDYYALCILNSDAVELRYYIESKDRFHAYQIEQLKEQLLRSDSKHARSRVDFQAVSNENEQLKEQLVQKDKKIIELKEYSRRVTVDLINEREDNIRLTKELREEREKHNQFWCHDESVSIAEETGDPIVRCTTQCSKCSTN